MKKIHYIFFYSFFMFFSIMICIITVSLVYSFHLNEENKYLEKHEECMKNNDFLYTQENCKYCDSLIKTY